MQYHDDSKIPRLEKFVLLSLLLHALVITFQTLIPWTYQPSSIHKPIKVKFIEPEKETPLPERSTLIDAPKPRKIEKPRTNKLLSRFDSRAHSNLNKNKAAEYRNRRLVAPKSSSNRRSVKKDFDPFKRETTRQLQKKVAAKPLPLPESNEGLRMRAPQEGEKSSPMVKSLAPPSLSAMLDGFDANKYASMDTGDLDDIDDDEVISLDTSESKYADYFARIKHQIELVWAYPPEAASRGISGEMTLRFRISKDGNLLGVRLIDSSGFEVLDFAALRAVKGAAPYYPFPDSIKREKIVILAKFIYSPSYSNYPYRR